MPSVPPAVDCTLSCIRAVTSTRMRRPLSTVSSTSLRVWSRALFAVGVVLSSLPLATAQVFTTTNSTMTPVPGTGHDYIHLLSETVNPANGSVSVNLNFPMPKGRGLSLPFSINYTSGQVIFQDTFVTYQHIDADGGGGTDNDKYTGSMGWLSDVGLLSSGGWSYGVPLANWKSWHSTFGPQLPPGETCPVTSGYIFFDLTGQAHVLGMGEAGYESGSESGVSQQCQSDATQGGDDFVSASLAPPPPDYSGGISTPLTVSDNASGTTYLFGGSLQSQATSNGELRTGILPYLIEDRNGNQVNVTQAFTNQNTGPFAFSFQDTLGRTIISDAAFQASPDTVVAGGQSYTVTWRTTSASYTVNQSQNVSDVGGNCTPVPAVSNSALTVISSITLPNGQKYHFYYGDDNPNGVSNPYGLLSEIDYPDGGWVRYTWKLSDTYSDLADYPSGDDQSSTGNPTYAILPDGCQFQYTAPVVATRTVGFGGSTAASQQSFTYSTTWDSQFPNRWDSKNTSVMTTDEVASKTSLKTYAYGSAYGDSAAYVYSNTPPQIPMELTVNSYDWGNTSNPIDVANKAWLDQYELACEFHTQNGTAVSGHFYQYAPGVQVSDDKGYDIGQIANPSSACTGVASGNTTPTAPSSPTPARETVRQFQSFTDLSGMTFASPQNELIYGNGTKIAETDYGYDAGSLASASAVSHDETNYGPSVTANRGNQTSVTRVNNGSNVLTTYGYDETGQVISQTDPCGNATCSDMSGTNHTTTYSYADNPASGNAAGASNAYLTKVTSPNPGTPHVSSYSYNYVQGLLTESVDLNGNPTDYSYSDALMRLTDSYGPPSAQNNNQRPDTHIAYVDGPGATVTTTDPDGVKSIATLDGFGRTTRTELMTDPSGPDYVDTVYNGVGGTNSVSNPYRSTNDPTYGITSYMYDALGRTTQQTNQDGTTEMWTWSGNTVSFQNENGNTWKRTSDAFGDLTQVLEPPTSSSPAAETDYQYDAQSNLTRVDQWGGPAGSAGDRVRTFVYDSLSRLTSSSTPESGTIGYFYDLNGNVATRTDARNIATNYSYDVLNRVASKTYSDGTPTAQLFYDQSGTVTVGSGINYFQNAFSVSNGIGRLTSQFTGKTSAGAGAAVRAFSYDPMGRVAGTAECWSSGECSNPYGTWLMQWTYDLAGHILSRNNGADRTFNYSYDSAGRLQTASHLTNNTNPVITTTMVSSMSYYPSGQSYVMTTNTGTSTVTGTWGIDNRLRTTSYSNLTSSGSGNTTYGYSLHYTPTSSVKSVSETTSQAGATPTSWSWTLLYDQLERLTNATSGGAISIACTETYDAWGNRIDQEPTPGMTGYSCSSRNTPVTAGTNFLASSSYDASGNTTFDGSNRYSYDAESRISSAAPTGQSATTYTYGADGALVSKNNGQTNFLRDLDGTLLDTFNGGSAQAQELWILGKHFGTVFPANNGTQVQNFSVTNWLGSEAARTDPATGLASSAYLSQPYGDQQLTIFGSDTNDIHFTGKEREVESGLDYFGARYYGSNMGRFTSPDPYDIVTHKNLGQSPKQRMQLLQSFISNPQAWNKYAYGLNNPLKNVDVGGNCSVPAGLQGGQTGVCVEAFIAAPRIGGVGLGDNRTFNPNGGTYRFRVDVRVDPGAAGGVSVNKDAGFSKVGTESINFGRRGTGDVTLGPIRTDDSGNRHFEVTGTAQNGFEAVNSLGTISFDLNFTATPDGTVTLDKAMGTTFPSIEAFSYNSSGQVTGNLLNSPEQESRDLKMPQQCLGGIQCP